MPKKKFYVVWKGRKTGVFTSWQECQPLVEKFSGAQYKSFKTQAEAQRAYDNLDRPINSSIDSTLDFLHDIEADTPNYDSISVDAACSGNPGPMEYRGVDTSTREEIFRKGPFEEGTNNIGEFLALVHGLALMKQNNDSRPIYTDSKIAMSWIRKAKCKTKVDKSIKNERLFDLIYRAEKWLKENTWQTEIIKWETKQWGEIPADFGRK